MKTLSSTPVPRKERDPEDHPVVVVVVVELGGSLDQFSISKNVLSILSQPPGAVTRSWPAASSAQSKTSKVELRIAAARWVIPARM